MIKKKTYTINQYSLLAKVKNITLFLAFTFAFSGFAQVTSSIDSTSIKIGEELRYNIQVLADSTDLVVFPEGTFGPLEVIESYEVDTTFEQAKFRLIKRYGLTQFDSGAYKIPSQKVYINETQFLTDSVRVEVRDVPVDTTKQKMFDIKTATEVDRPPFDLLKLLYWLIPMLLIGLTAYLLFRRKKKREAKEEQLPPFEEAMIALKKLDSSNLLHEDKSKEYYSHLTEIVKRYLDREVDDTALESTSDELIERLQLHKDAGHFDFDMSTIKQLDQILKRADLVKFAKMKQDMGQAEADRGAIESIINETHEVIPEPTEEELLQNQQYLEEQQRKRRTKRIITAVVTGFLVLVITSGVFIGIYGWTYVKDNVFGHPTKELAEGRWVRSEYGSPALIIETPKVLVRMDLPLTEEIQQQIKSNSAFQYGSMLGNFYIMLSSTDFNNEEEIELEPVMEAILTQLEEQGAKNLVVKREEFETDKGVKGLKSYGTFLGIGPNGSRGVEQKYQVLVFGQKGALQQLTIAHSAEDIYAEDVVKRITDSVELEINNTETEN